jgi:hypothetical protein
MKIHARFRASYRSNIRRLRACNRRCQQLLSPAITRVYHDAARHLPCGLNSAPLPDLHRH